MKTREPGGLLPRCAGGVYHAALYISTSGVYGDCRGARVFETRAVDPHTGRAARRVAAERELRRFGATSNCRVAILRAPGIYAADRLPLKRLRQSTPVFAAGDDSYTNHIHADDLGRACQAALERGRANRLYNASDDSDLPMGDWFDKLADAFGLPRPPRLSRVAAQTAVSPTLLSFMNESRRLDNRRLKTELKLRLRYPTVDVGIAAAREKNRCSG